MGEITIPSGATAMWYLRSYKDEDTHRASAVAGDGTVRAVCGAVFAPLANPLDGSVGLRAAPADALQVCPVS